MPDQPSTKGRRPGRVCVVCARELVRYPPDVNVCGECRIPVRTVFDGTYADPHTGDAHELTPELFIGRSRWVFAKTMPDVPHEYTVRDLTTPTFHRSTCLSHDAFEWFVVFIRERGYDAQWRKSRHVYLEVGGWKYWTMGAAPEHTTIINRARVAPRRGS